MGQAKRELERLEGLYQTAKGILTKTGAIEDCEWHDEIFVTNDDEDAVRHAYALGAIMVKKGEVDATHQEMSESIKSVMDDAAWDCPRCEKIAAE